MSTHRLSDTQIDPAFSLFRVELSLQTCLHEPRYQAWLKANLFALAFEFYNSDEFEPDAEQVEATFGIFARRKFLEGRVTA